jgi:hypothetical protein
MHPFKIVAHNQISGMVATTLDSIFSAAIFKHSGKFSVFKHQF